MKRILILVAVVAVISGCCCTNRVAVRQVAVVPVTPVFQTVTFGYNFVQPLDVTTTTIDFY